MWEAIVAVVMVGMLGMVALVLVLVVIPKLVLHLMSGPLQARIAEQYREEEIVLKDLTANSFGLESEGPLSGRGNGALVLTANHLHFFRFVPKSELRIPLDSIVELDLTKSHRGKATIFNLLKVRFTVEGKPDSIAWYLTDPGIWKSRIEECITNRD